MKIWTYHLYSSYVYDKRIKQVDISTSALLLLPSYSTHVKYKNEGYMK